MTELPPFSPSDASHLQRALELARLGEGSVEPNPMVGCVIVRDGRVVGEGWHRMFGGPHAEVEALRRAGADARAATLYVTLEPCCHHGKTPPCTDAILAAGLRRVVIAQRDPFPQVNGGGIRVLREAGVDVRVGLREHEARELNAPYHKLIETGRPWVIAKWAMTLDGKIATRTGDSQWISSEASRAIVHQLRGRVDAIVIGSGTARGDDPLLTARPTGPRTATRIVLDSRAALALDSRLAQSAREVPLLVVTGRAPDSDNVQKLQEAGAEVLVCRETAQAARLGELLDELGRRRLTNVLVEGGAGVLGTFHDADLLDEVHVFIAPKLIGGAEARSPLAGLGLAQVEAARSLASMTVEQVAGDVYLHGRLQG